MAEEAEFRVEIKDFRATDLTSRNRCAQIIWNTKDSQFRFRDKLRIVGEFDDQKFKTKKELIGNIYVQNITGFIILLHFRASSLR